MRARRRHRIYRACITLYPAAFRRHYREDLVQHFDDLVVNRGVRRAFLRTGLDLAVTVPNQRLEPIMSQPHGATALVVLISLLAGAGVAGFLTGVGPGLVLVGAAAVLAVVRRNALADAVRTPVAGRRRHWLITSAVLASVFLFCAVTYLLVIGDSWTMRETVLASVGTLAMVGAPVFLLIGLLTPRTDPAPPSDLSR